MSVAREELSRLEGLLQYLSLGAAAHVEHVAAEVRAVVVKAGDGGYGGLLLAAARLRVEREEGACSCGPDCGRRPGGGCACRSEYPVGKE